MKITVHTLATLNRHGEYFELFSTKAAAEHAAAVYCAEKFSASIKEAEADNKIDWEKATDREAVDFCMDNLASDDDNLTFGQEELTITAPAGIVEAARLGMAALKLARDCFRSACADRTLERVQLALSSAKGALRHAEEKAVRS